MKTAEHTPAATPAFPLSWERVGPHAARAAMAAVAVALTAASAILVKERAGMARPLVALERTAARGEEAPPSPGFAVMAAATSTHGTHATHGTHETHGTNATSEELVAADRVAAAATEDLDPQTLALARDARVRWFDGRPVRPARQIWMTVTGYSPDERSCGEFADGQTATLHSVFTNGMKLVAADTSVLPFGSMVSIPGYDGARVVPVLDRGGAIKGNKLDLLFPTHEEALEWGKKRLVVTVWEYADGKPAGDPRKAR